MTTRSGDALSHVNFQARRGIVFDGGRLPRLSASTLRLIVVNRVRARSTRFCIAGMSGHPRNEIGRPPSFEHYLHKSLLNV
jgi:hypothetical protein